MSQVFITYRQTDNEQLRRVRSFAERLRNSGIDVVLDQFFLEANPGGPDEGWDKWSSDRALKTEDVLIVGTDSWFQCFEKAQPPALDRKDWLGAESFAREALFLSEKIGRQELIAHACLSLAIALVLKDRRDEAHPHAERAVEIFTRLGLNDLEKAREILAECEAI